MNQHFPLLRMALIAVLLSGLVLGSAEAQKVAKAPRAPGQAAYNQQYNPATPGGDWRGEGQYVYPGNPYSTNRAYEVPRHQPGLVGPAHIPTPPVRPLPKLGRQQYAPGCNVDITSLPLLGCDIVAANGTFLGTIDRDCGRPNSIANRSGRYGNPCSPLSVWNPNGAFGSPAAPLSPWNRFSNQPPALYWHGVFRGYLSANPAFQPKVHPDRLADTIRQNPWR